jgi:hypothetical protein
MIYFECQAKIGRGQVLIFPGAGQPAAVDS